MFAALGTVHLFSGRRRHIRELLLLWQLITRGGCVVLYVWTCCEIFINTWHSASLRRVIRNSTAADYLLFLVFFTEAPIHI